MRYVERALLANEQIRHAARTSIWYLLPEILLGLLLVPLFGLGLVILADALIRYATTETVITNERIMARLGLIRPATIELNLVGAESIRIDQGWLGRQFDYGNIVVSGSGHPQPPIPGISQPRVFRQRFLEFQEQAINSAAHSTVASH